QQPGAADVPGIRNDKASRLVEAAERATPFVEVSHRVTCSRHRFTADLKVRTTKKVVRTFRFARRKSPSRRTIVAVPSDGVRWRLTREPFRSRHPENPARLCSGRRP